MDLPVVVIALITPALLVAVELFLTK